MVAITHAFVSAIGTDPAATSAGKVTPDKWNENHAIAFAATKKILARVTAGSGAAEEASLSDILDFLTSPADGAMLLRSSGVWVYATAVLLNAAQTFIGAQCPSTTVLTSASNSIAISLSANNNFSHTFTENTTLANPTNIVAGQSGAIFFTQHASSPKTLAYGSYWKFIGGSIPTVTASNSAADTLYYTVRSSTFIEATLAKGFA